MNALTVTGHAALSPLAKRSIEPMPPWVMEISRRMAVWQPSFGPRSTCLVPLPTADQRTKIETSRGQLAAQLEQTPENNPEAEQVMLAAIGELMLSKPYRADDGELRREATIRSFGYALDDVPVWATLRAIRNWHRGKCDPYNNPKIKYAYRWMPDPTDLRKIAESYVAEVRDRIAIFDDILNAVEPDEFRKGTRQLPPPAKSVADDSDGFQTISQIGARVLAKSKAKATA